MHEHSLIELYVNLSDNRLNTQIEQQLSSVDLDGIVVHTLEAVNIRQPAMLTLLITDDDGIRDMNKQYREQNKATDVLSFPLLEQPLAQAPADQLWTPQPTADTEHNAIPPFVNPPDATTNLGDIVMSWPTIVQQATEAGHDTPTELLYLLSHGVLHLVGYDDQTEAGYEAMVRIQHSVLQTSGYKV